VGAKLQDAAARRSRPFREYGRSFARERAERAQQPAREGIAKTSAARSTVRVRDFTSAPRGDV